jgi:hypothetical protein
VLRNLLLISNLTEPDDCDTAEISDIFTSFQNGIPVLQGILSQLNVDVSTQTTVGVVKDETVESLQNV